jgi:hypothetical protein
VERAATYDLDQLGWLQFERLCALVLEAEAGLSGLAWSGHSDEAREVTLDGPVALAGRTVRGRTGRQRAAAGSGPSRASRPTHLAILWAPEARPPLTRRLELARRLARLTATAELDGGGRVVLFTNLTAADALRGAVALLDAAAPPILVLGAGEISDSLDRRPELRAALPSVLGLRDLAPLISPEVRARSSFDVDGARALARVFSPTRAFDRARDVLARHRFVVLTGPPEMGKTAIARMVALAKLTDGWEAHECNRPDQVWSAFDSKRAQVFVADDAFGSTEYRPDAAERWANELARLLGVLDDHHWLIWTSRPAPLKAGLRRVQRERGSERFPAPGQILVDAGDLDLAEKTLILFRHAKDPAAGRAVRRWVRATGPSIVDHPHFTPERIRRLVTDRSEELRDVAGAPRDALFELVERELAIPTEAMSTSFAALEPEHRMLLIAMLDAPAGLVDERQLAATLRRHHPGGLTRPPGELIDRLTDHFVRITPLGIGWVHPSWRDLVIEELRNHAGDRQRFLGACGPHGAMLVLSHAGGPTGERALPLLVADADWDRFTDRIRQLLRELEDPDLARLLLAIADTMTAPLPAAQLRELSSLAEYALGATRRSWDAARRPVPLARLGAWYALNIGLPEPVQAPELGATWAELRPASGPLTDRADLTRADDWLALAQLLAEHDPKALAGLGLPGREAATLERLIAAAEQTARGPDDQLRPLALSILVRVRGLAPTGATYAHAVHAQLLVEGPSIRDHWWAPADLDAPPTDEPAGPRELFTADDVARVLRDL